MACLQVRDFKVQKKLSAHFAFHACFIYEIEDECASIVQQTDIFLDMMLGRRLHKPCWAIFRRTATY